MEGNSASGVTVREGALQSCFLMLAVKEQSPCREPLLGTEILGDEGTRE